jgi:hypothetical protein
MHQYTLILACMHAPLRVVACMHACACTSWWVGKAAGSCARSILFSVLTYRCLARVRSSKSCVSLVGVVSTQAVGGRPRAFLCSAQ